jgi:hypothetical protein
MRLRGAGDEVDEGCLGRGYSVEDERLIGVDKLLHPDRWRGGKDQEMLRF